MDAITVGSKWVSRLGVPMVVLAVAGDMVTVDRLANGSPVGEVYEWHVERFDGLTRCE